MKSGLYNISNQLPVLFSWGCELCKLFAAGLVWRWTWHPACCWSTVWHLTITFPKQRWLSARPMKYSMMLGFQLFTSLNPVIRTTTSPEGPSCWSSGPLCRVWTSSVESWPLGAIYNLTPSLWGTTHSTALILQVLKERFLKNRAAICTSARIFKRAFHQRVDGVFSSYNPKLSEPRPSTRWQVGHLWRIFLWWFVDFSHWPHDRWCFTQKRQNIAL